MSTTLPFSKIEEAVYNIEQKFTPWNIQAELETTETIDLDRLRDAVVVAAGTHPIVGASQTGGRSVDAQYVWELPEESVEVAIGEVDGTGDLEAVRNELYFDGMDLSEEPPFRVLVRRGDGIDGGDRLLVSASHVAVDGVGTLRVAQAICRAYKGQRPVEDSVGLVESREMLEDLKPRTVGDGLDMLDAARRHLVDTVDEPARVAADRSPDHPGWGWGFTRRELSAAETQQVVGERPDGVSVNDVFQAALHTAIEDWNEDHGESARKISVMMPVNLRPEEWFYEVASMYSMFESVTTRSRDRTDPETAARAVSEQTSELKDRERAAALYEPLDLIPDSVPLGLRRQLPALLRGPGKRLLDTAMLTNLGRIPAIPSLAEDSEERAWFTPPVWEGTPVGIGVATFEGNATFCIRYRRAVLDRDGAERFADTFVDHVRAAIE